MKTPHLQNMTSSYPLVSRVKLDTAPSLYLEQVETFKTSPPDKVEDGLARGGGAYGNQICRWADMFGFAWHIFLCGVIHLLL